MWYNYNTKDKRQYRKGDIFMEDNAWQKWEVLVKFRNRLEQIILKDSELKEIAYEFYCAGGKYEEAQRTIDKILRYQKWHLEALFAKIANNFENAESKTERKISEKEKTFIIELENSLLKSHLGYDQKTQETWCNYCGNRWGRFEKIEHKENCPIVFLNKLRDFFDIEDWVRRIYHEQLSRNK